MLTKSGNKKYLKNSDFCGPSGGAGTTKFPVNTEKRCRAALSYARTAPNPNGIVRCALNKAKKMGWRCGVSRPKQDCGCGLAI